MIKNMDLLNTKEVVKICEEKITIYNLNKLQEQGIVNIDKLPYSIRILLEAVLRHAGEEAVNKEDVLRVGAWNSDKLETSEIPFIPSRVILQDFTGVPAVVDLAAIRTAIERLGGNPHHINPVVPVDLVIDHSIQVDYYGTKNSINLNEQAEFARNKERYELLHWAQRAFDNFRVVPPSNGIIHQINLEYLSPLVHFKITEEGKTAYPDSVVGTDSHTTMINGLGVLGWGVGGIEAEAVMLNQPYYMSLPEVIGFKLNGKLKDNVTATDLVLTITQMLREYGVVEKFVEFYGPGVSSLDLTVRATLANMSPEYGATMGFFPADEKTLEYMLLTGRDKKHVDMVREYLKIQKLFVEENSSEPVFTHTLELDMSTVEPCLAGPKRPQDRITLAQMPSVFHTLMETSFQENKDDNISVYDPKYAEWLNEGGYNIATDIKTKEPSICKMKCSDDDINLKHGSIVIASITSCTNTSNPSVLIGAGLLAKKAIDKGLKVKPFVKTSLSPGSRVVAEYLNASGLMPYLEALGFHHVGYGCTTCIGNSGPLKPSISKTIKDKDLTVAAVLSGNRNFEGRINAQVKANYLASPMLVIAYALAGNVDVDLSAQPISCDPNGHPIYLVDIWPTESEIKEYVGKYVSSDMFKNQYSNVFMGNALWQQMETSESLQYQWNSSSTYIQEPPFFKNFPLNINKKEDIINSKVLAFLGDSITTDHISPAGSIPVLYPAGQYLINNNIDENDFNSYGSRRGNHEVMMRGTFGNVRLKNKLTPNKVGSWTMFFMDQNKEMYIYDAAMQYMQNNIPLIVIAGKEYGTGSSRDWAAKGTQLLGVKAVIAESYERIHRSNLIGMGVLPLQFKPDESAQSLGLDGTETYDINTSNLKLGTNLKVSAHKKDGTIISFDVIARINSSIELEYINHGGILHKFLREKIKEK